MSNDGHYRRLVTMYDAAPINEYFKPVLTVGDRTAEVSITVREDFFHAAHSLHGTVYFKAMDDAAFFAAQSVVRDVFVLTVSFNLVLLRPVTGGTITASGQLSHASRNLLVAEAGLKDDAGVLVAKGQGTFMRSRMALGADVGYR